jgi:hypothetical protein
MNTENLGWSFDWMVEKYDPDSVAWIANKRGIPREAVTSALMAGHRIKPGEVVDIHGNLLTNEGINALLHLLIGDGSVTAFSAGSARIGVGDSTQAAVAGDSDLVGTKSFQAMKAGWPKIAAGTGVTTCEWAADFASGVAEFAGGWQEWGVDNGTGGGRLLNRKVANLGAGKTTTLWTMTGQVTIPN